MNIDLKVSQLVVSRICHDLAGSVSAVNAGVELIKDDATTIDQEAMSLIDASANQSVRKLSFFRIVFGSGGGVNGSISLTELHDLARNFVEGSKITISWPEQTDIERVDLDDGKALLGLILIAVDGLPRGGVISASVHNTEDGVGFAVVAKGERASLAPEINAALNPNISIDDLSPRTVHAYFTNIFVKYLGGEMEYIGEIPEEIRLSAIIPK
ncbi:MAG: histidine phosphotransferase family protein [Rhodospirillaceae bacterium]|nr:histidine phosphotransferase family protein [Rhodospirillaceae bacterium]